MTVHKIIWQQFSQHKDLVDPVVLPPNASFEQFCKLMFRNWTPHFASLRLTNLGFATIKNLYQTWAIPLPANWNQLETQGTILVKLHQNCRTPYFWDRKCFYVFSSETALELEMANRDLAVWSKMF